MSPTQAPTTKPPNEDLPRTPSYSKPTPDQTPPRTKTPLTTILSAHDFEQIAQHTLSPKTWAFYSSGATDQHTQHANATLLSRIWLRPRVLRDVRSIRTGTATMLGVPLAFPLFASPAAMMGLVHPGGEKAMARALRRARLPMVVSTNASWGVEEIVGAAAEVDGLEDQGAEWPVFFQLYVNRDREATRALLERVGKAGVRGIFLTVDAPVPGKREADERVAVGDDGEAGAVPVAPMSGAVGGNDERGGGLGRTMGRYVDAGVTWRDVRWVKEVAGGLKVVLKGVQTVEDARLAVEAGADGIVVSNHGGRSLDTSTPAILVLLELRRNAPEVFERLEVFVDSGIRRGTDIFKCLCLGAKAVGMARSFLYALNYGEEGVTKLINIMRDEFETTMRLMGVTDLSQLHPGLLNTLDIDHMVPSSSMGGEMSSSPRNPKARL